MNKAGPVCRLQKQDVLLVVLLLVVGFWVRQWHIGLPETRYFDETYYSKAGEELLDGKPDSNTVHPPLAKLIIAGTAWIYSSVGIPLQEQGWVGGVTHYSKYRIGSLLFALFTIPLTYALAFVMFRSRFAAFTAGFLLDIDFLHVVQSRITMLDMYLAFFILVGGYAAWRYIDANRQSLGWAVLSALSFCIGFACKWNSLFAAFGAVIAMVTLKKYPRERATLTDRVLFVAFVVVLAVAVAAGLHYGKHVRWRGVALAYGVLIAVLGLCLRWNFRLPALRGTWTALPRLSLLYALLVPTMYLVAFLPFMWQHHWDMKAAWNDAKANHKQMIEFRYSTEFTHRYMSNFWSWPTVLRPVWYHYEEHKEREGSLIPPRTDRWLWRLAWRGQEPETYVTGILAMGSPFVWWTYLIFLLLTMIQSLVMPGLVILRAACMRNTDQDARDHLAREADAIALMLRDDEATGSEPQVPAEIHAAMDAGPLLNSSAADGDALDREAQAAPGTADADTAASLSASAMHDGATDNLPPPAPLLPPWRREVDAWRFGTERPWLFLMLLYFPQVLLWSVNRGFLFYMLPCVPFMCVFIAGILREWLDLPYGRLCAALYMLVAVLFFVAYYPLLAAWSIPKPIYELLVLSRWI